MIRDCSAQATSGSTKASDSLVEKGAEKKRNQRQPRVCNLDHVPVPWAWHMLDDLLTIRAPGETHSVRVLHSCLFVLKLQSSVHLIVGKMIKRRHTGERPYTCRCGRTFSRLDNVRQHASIVHREELEDNALMLEELTTLHHSLSLAASAFQVSAGMVVDVASRNEGMSIAGPSTSASPKSTKRKFNRMEVNDNLKEGRRGLDDKAAGQYGYASGSSSAYEREDGHPNSSTSLSAPLSSHPSSMSYDPTPLPSPPTLDRIISTHSRPLFEASPSRSFHSVDSRPGYHSSSSLVPTSRINLPSSTASAHVSSTRGSRDSRVTLPSISRLLPTPLPHLHGLTLPAPSAIVASRLDPSDRIYAAPRSVTSHSALLVPPNDNFSARSLAPPFHSAPASTSGNLRQHDPSPSSHSPSPAHVYYPSLSRLPSANYYPPAGTRTAVDHNYGNSLRIGRASVVDHSRRRNVDNIHQVATGEYLGRERESFTRSTMDSLPQHRTPPVSSTHPFTSAHPTSLQIGQPQRVEDKMTSFIQAKVSSSSHPSTSFQRSTHLDATETTSSQGVPLFCSGERRRNGFIETGLTDRVYAHARSRSVGSSDSTPIHRVRKTDNLDLPTSSKNEARLNGFGSVTQSGEGELAEQREKSRDGVEGMISYERNRRDIGGWNEVVQDGERRELAGRARETVRRQNEQVLDSSQRIELDVTNQNQVYSTQLWKRHLADESAAEMSMRANDGGIDFTNSR